MNVLKGQAGYKLAGVEATGMSMHEFCAAQLQAIYPDASQKTVDRTLNYAADLVDSTGLFVDTVDYSSDPIAPVVSLGSALAVAAHGVKVFGRKKDGLVPSSGKANAFWDDYINFVAPKSKAEKSAKRQSPLISEAQLRDDFSYQAPAHVYELADEVTENLGGIFEGFSCVMNEVRIVSQDEEELAEGYAVAEAKGLKDPYFETSHYCIDEGKIVLGKKVGGELLRHGSQADHGLGILAHELGHAYTATHTQFQLGGREVTSSILCEVLAEYGRTMVGYSGASYISEHKLQWALNDAAGTDIIWLCLRAGGDRLLKTYRNALVNSVGIMAAGLILGAQPEEYDRDPARIPRPQLNLLAKESRGRYGPLRQYVPPEHRAKLRLWNKAPGIWRPHQPADQRALRRLELMDQLLNGMTSTQLRIG